MTDHSTAERAAFYRTALLLGLIKGDSVVRWADDVLAASSGTQAAFAEIAAIPSHDLTALRLALLHLCSDREPSSVIGAVLGLIARDLMSGRRSTLDTLTVLKQLRGFVRLNPDLAEELKQIELVSMRAAATGGTAALDHRVRQWLGQYEGAEKPFQETA